MGPRAPACEALLLQCGIISPARIEVALHALWGGHTRTHAFTQMRLHCCSRLAGRRIVFQPYSKDQLTTIITSRLGEARLPRQLWCSALASPA